MRRAKPWRCAAWPSLHLGFALALSLCGPAAAEPLRCAVDLHAPAAKPVQAPTAQASVVAIFAQFAGEERAIPAWADEIFDPDRPGSFVHFYDTMSFGRHRLDGQVAPRVYSAAQPAAAYLAATPTEQGDFARFNTEVLRAADAEIDFARFDNDGPDGIANSGDDDGVVDAVFIVLSSTPANFILGGATGVGELGFEEAYLTDDPGVDGEPIRIAPTQGTLQGGNSYVQVVGSICHEYGHVLGLPDLFDTEFLQRDDRPGPEEDSAGIGIWGLMGWGALGWNRDDGPTSFSGWSRLQLGWAQATEPGQTRQQIELEDVGRSGALYKITLNRNEFFLLEYRRRASSYYDRNIPAEGLLVWHVELPNLALEEGVVRTRVDLECADGRWRDAGFPAGREPAPATGGDNLDFWAHDAAYAQAHAGNLGDASDPFDGATYRAFTPDTNPAAHSADGLSFIRLEDIRIDGDRARAGLELAPTRVEIADFMLIDADGDRRATTGEEVQVQFQVVHTGGVALAGLTARIESDDPHVEVIDPPLALGDLDVDGRAVLVGPGGLDARRPIAGARKLGFRLKPDFVGWHTAQLTLHIDSAQGPLAQLPFSARALSPLQRVEQARVADPAGNGDGAAQAGEFVGIELSLELFEPEALALFEFALTPLGATQLVGNSRVFFALGDDGRAHSVDGPEFLVPAPLAPGAELALVLTAANASAAWRDTLRIPVAPGPDQTPPRVAAPLALLADGGTELFVPGNLILDGGPIDAVEAVIYAFADTTELARLPLAPTGSRYAAVWAAPRPGFYLGRIVATDAAGNRGVGPLAPFAARAAAPEQAAPPGHPWENLGPTVDDWREFARAPVVAPSNPAVLYVLTTQGLLRSVDGGATLQAVGPMFSRDLRFTPRLFVDALSPFALYLGDPVTRLLARSFDGGDTWQELDLPHPDRNGQLLAADPRIFGRLYLESGGALWISDDGGDRWRQTEVRLPGARRLFAGQLFVLFHPTDPQTIYAGDTAGDHPVLWRSRDGGDTWSEQGRPPLFVTVAADPQDPDGLYAGGFSTLWHSADGGVTWQQRNSGDRGFADGLYTTPLAPARIIAWSGDWLGLSADGGRTWQDLRTPQEFLYQQRLAFDPDDPLAFYLVGSDRLWRTADAGRSWRPVAMPAAQPEVRALLLDGAGGIVAGSAVAGFRSGRIPVLYIADGTAWRRGRTPSSYRDGPFDVLTRDPRDPQRIVAHAGGSYARSDDGGANWRSTLSQWFGFSRLWNGLLPQIVADPHQEGAYYIADSEIFRSADAGVTWQGRNDGLPAEQQAHGPLLQVNSFAVDQTIPDRLYAAVGAEVWRSDDAGGQWVLASAPESAGRVVHLATSAAAPQRLYAATHGQLFASDDGGAQWQALLKAESGFWPRPQLRFDPTDPATLYLLTGPRLLHSRDGGRHWRSLGEGVGVLPWFDDLAVDPADPQVVLTATPRGVYRLDTRAVRTAVAESAALPPDFALAANYPNPFNGSTAIRFALPRRQAVRLEIYNLAGQRVATVLDGPLAAGAHEARWRGRDDQGRALASGVYFYRLETSGRTAARKLLLLR